MRGLRFGGRLNQKTIYISVVTVVLVLAFVVFLLMSHRHKPLPLGPSGNSGPSSAVIASSDKISAQQAVKSQDYQSAVNYYIEAVNAAEANGDNQQAESLLKDAISKIPDAYVPWEIWDDMVGVAKAQGNKSLEISSIKKAIIKAQQPNSGAPASIIDIYNNMLKQLGAS